jgi:guanylate cyclase, other
MESTGMQLKIHCSDDCRAMLEKLGGYLFEDRGLIPMKGKGDKKTFWLLGEDPDIRARRTRERKERRGSKALNKFIQKNNLPFMNNGDLLGIRSSMKQNNNGYGPLFKSLPRSSSLESPKKLRFASTTFLEYNRYHHG